MKGALLKLTDDMKFLLKRECSIWFIDGHKRDGKSDFALNVLDTARFEGFIDKIATNITVFDPKAKIQKICYYDGLERWCRSEGRKGYFLDELGKHLNRVRFMSELSKLILDVVQLAGHYDLHLIGAGVSEGLVDKLFTDQDLLDIRIRKTSKQRAKVVNYISRESYDCEDIPRTRINFNSKDIAFFGIKNPKSEVLDLTQLRRCCQCAYWYLKIRSFRKVAEKMNCSFQNVGDMLDRHNRHMKPSDFA